MSLKGKKSILTTGGAGDGLQSWQRALTDFLAVLITLCTPFMFQVVAP